MKLISVILVVALLFAACRTTKQTMSLKDNNNVADEKKIEMAVADTTEYLKNIYTDRDKYIVSQQVDYFMTSK